MNIFKAATSALFFSLFVAQSVFCMDGEISNLRDMHNFMQERDGKIADNRINDTGWLRYSNKQGFERNKNISTAMSNLTKKMKKAYPQALDKFYENLPKKEFFSGDRAIHKQNLNGVVRIGVFLKKRVPNDCIFIPGVGNMSIRRLMNSAKVCFYNMCFKEDFPEKVKNENKVKFGKIVNVLIFPENKKTTDFLR